MTRFAKQTFGALALSACLTAGGSAQAAIIQVTANVSGTTTWHNTNEYVLNGFIYVLGGGVLNIEAGTVIKAKPGQDLSTSCLIVTRGGKIYANGTRTQPIIFTAEADDVLDPGALLPFQRGLWGGVVLLGSTVLNTATDVAGNAASPKYDVFEGLPDTQIGGQYVNRFGGNDDNDNSGVLRYVSLRRCGVVFQPNKELNGLSLGAVGRGTTIDHVEMYAAADDGIEFFGGTVNTKYLVSAFNDDDCFDIDQGYRGKNQFWFAIQERGKKDNGGEWNGEPNGIAVGASPVANYEIYNATWIGAGTNTTGNRGLTVREYAAPRVYNSILTEFGGNGISIDTKSAIHLTNGVLDLRDNLWWNFATNGLAVALPATAEAQILFSDATRSNEVVNPLLRSISRTNEPAYRLDPRPTPGSPAATSLRVAPDDGFYNPVAYKGAFDTNDLWIGDWTFLAHAGFVAPRALNTIQVTANLSGKTFWSRTNEYVLNGFIYVLGGATLEIEAGTVIKAKPGQDLSTSCLIVTRGGKINANGTANNPIIFTAEADDVLDPGALLPFQRGLWGGLVLLGSTVLNTATDVAGNAASPKYDVFEGLPDTQIGGQYVNRFGGNDDNDNSGVLRYVSLRRCGVVFQPNKELNGLSLGAVGRGTTIDHVEMYAAADDGIEFFGGTVNTKYLVSAFNDDDCFDIDQGYRGKNQFWFAIQERGKKDNGGEWNGEPNGIAVGASPVANYEIYNATWIGAGTNTTGNRGLTVREYAAPKVYNSILTEFGGNGISIDTKSAIHLTNGVLDLRDNLWWNFATNGLAVALPATAEAQILFSDATRSNEVVNPLLRSISRTNAPAFRLNPLPATNSPALASLRVAPNDGFYNPVTFKGAFNKLNWATDWTALGENSFLNTADAGQPLYPTVVALPFAPMLGVARSSAGFVLSFPTESGRNYQVQSTPALIHSNSWSNVGTAIPGTGSSVSVTNPIGAGNQFIRVQAQ